MFGIDGRVDEADPHRGRAAIRHRPSLGPANDMTRQALVRTARIGTVLIGPVEVIEVDHRVGCRSCHLGARRFERRAAGNAQFDDFGPGECYIGSVADQIAGGDQVRDRTLIKSECHDLLRRLARKCGSRTCRSLPAWFRCAE
jgi:hypothetical protein